MITWKINMTTIQDIIYRHWLSLIYESLIYEIYVYVNMSWKKISVVENFFLKKNCFCNYSTTKSNTMIIQTNWSLPKWKMNLMALQLKNLLD